MYEIPAGMNKKLPVWNKNIDGGNEIPGRQNEKLMVLRSNGTMEGLKLVIRYMRMRRLMT